MKLTCDVVQDLLPLYIDQICSEDSRAAVEAHLQECEACRRHYQRMAAVEPQQSAPKPTEEKQFKKGMKKVRRRWTVSLVAMLLVVPLVWMTVNQVRGDGVCFTNVYEIVAANRFLSLMKQERYAEAFDCLDSEGTWASLTDYDSYDNVLEGYTPVTIDGMVWYFEDPQEFWAETPAEVNGEDALKLWLEFYQHGGSTGTFILPQEAYEALDAQYDLTDFWDEDNILWWDEGDILQAFVQDHEGNGYYIGNFIDPLWDSTSEVEEDALYDWWMDYPCIPESLWNEIKENDQQERTKFEARAQAYLDMGYDAWLAATREQFVARMEEWSEKEGAITRFRLRHAYSSNGGVGASHIGRWQLEYDLWFEGEAESQGGIMLFASMPDAIAEDKFGTVDIAGGFIQTYNSKVDRFLDWLYDAAWYELDG